MKPLIAPSILSANFARLGEDVREAHGGEVLRSLDEKRGLP